MSIIYGLLYIKNSNLHNELSTLNLGNDQVFRVLKKREKYSRHSIHECA